jgi:hypothetical protein
MFLQLFQCAKPDQEAVAKAALERYRPIWDRKHHRPPPSAARYLAGLSEDPIADDLDPADAEFEEGATEFEQGIMSDDHAEYTRHFASAIRSSIVAEQINVWIANHAESYRRWRDGQSFNGPTFLDAPTAVRTATAAWVLVEKSLAEALKSRPRPARDGDVEAHYKEWEESIA